MTGGKQVEQVLWLKWGGEVGGGGGVGWREGNGGFTVSSDEKQAL